MDNITSEHLYNLFILGSLGEWHGSFTRLSSTGQELEDTPSVLSLEGLNNNQTVKLVLRRFPTNQPPNELVREFSSLDETTLFFENGAFSQGQVQWGPFSQFAVELGLIEGDRRLRLVQLFKAGGELDRLVLIREKFAGSNTPERPPLTVEQLLGEWQGEAVTIYPDLRKPDIYPTYLQIKQERDGSLSQKLTFGTKTVASSAQIKGSILHFDQGEMPVQIMLLPDGGSANFPVQIKSSYPFFLESGWLIEPGLRQRMIRTYNEKGEWVSLTLVREKRE